MSKNSTIPRRNIIKGGVAIAGTYRICLAVFWLSAAYSTVMPLAYEKTDS